MRANYVLIGLLCLFNRIALDLDILRTIVFLIKHKSTSPNFSLRAKATNEARDEEIKKMEAP